MESINIKMTGVGNQLYGDYLFKDLMLTIPGGEVVGLFGHNGSGKSTLHRILGNLEPATKGAVTINGQVNDFNQFRNDVVLIPDQVMLFQNKTISANYKFITKQYKLDKQVFDKLLAILNLNEKQYVSDLSKGNQEMLQLIIYFSIDASVYLLDEPFGAVDIFRRKFINKLFIETILRRSDASIIVTTHLISEIEPILDRVVYLDQGAIKFDVLCDQIYEVSDSVVSYIEAQFEELNYEELLQDDQ